MPSLLPMIADRAGTPLSANSISPQSDAIAAPRTDAPESRGPFSIQLFFLALLRAGLRADVFFAEARLETAAVRDAVFRAGAFFAADFFAAGRFAADLRAAGFFTADFRAAGFLAAFLAVPFFAAGFLAAALLAGLRAADFLAADFFAAGLLAAFLTGDFLAADFLAPAFFFAGFFAVFVFMTLVPLLDTCSPKPAARRKKPRVISSLWFQTHWSSNGKFLLRLSKKSIDIAKTLLLTGSE